MTQTSLEKVKLLIEEDREYFNKKEWPLIPATDIIEISLDDSIECIKNKNVIKPNFNRPFDENIDNIFSNITNKNVVIAGGYVCNHVMDIKTTTLTDIDVFFYGKEDECSKSLNEIITFIKNKYKKDNIKWSRNKYVINCYIRKYINYKYENIMIQFITKNFPSKSFIIGQFDINASAILYDGKQILLTPLSAFAYATRCNYVDTFRKSDTYEYRLIKYFNSKNFSIAFPELKSGTLDMLRSDKYAYNNYRNSDFYAIKDINFVKVFEGIKYTKRNRDYQSVYGDNYTFNGNNIEKFVKLFIQNKHEKIYVDIDINTLECTFKKNINFLIKDFYANAIPSKYYKTINQLRMFYPPDIFNKLMISYIDDNLVNEKNIKDEYVTKFIKEVNDFLDNYKNNIDWNINENPLCPKPMKGIVWYNSEYYRPIFKEITATAETTSKSEDFVYNCTVN